MTNNMKIILIGLAVLLAAYFLNSYAQKSRRISPDIIFNADRSNISAFTLHKGQDSLTLQLVDVWTIDGHDSLVVKEKIMDNFLDRTLTVRKGSIVSKNPEKWSTYSVNDILGTTLSVLDGDGKDAGTAVFGTSKSDFSRNYVRFGDDPNVYQTDISIIFQLQPNPAYWGSNPTPPDTSETES